jgi:hypothetical protein
MKALHKILIVKSWGFTESYAGNGRYTRKAPMNYLEVWSTSSPDKIFFYDGDQFSHEYDLNWDDLAESYSHIIDKVEFVEFKL